MSRRLTWFVPATAVALVAAGTAWSASAATAAPELPDVTAQDLLARVAEAEPVAMSGTVSSRSALGLPALPGGALGGSEDAAATDPGSLLSRLLLGSSTVRVWSDADERFRASLDDDFAEVLVVRDGDTAWTYSSEDDVATRYDLAELAARHDAGTGSRHGSAGSDSDGSGPVGTGSEGHGPMGTDLTDVTPQELAGQLLEAADSTTEVTVDGTARVAGQDAYRLVLDPRTAGTLVDRIEVAVDAETDLVLDVAVYAVGQADAAFRTGFDRISYGEPDADVFAFSPPEGTEIVEGGAADDEVRPEHALPELDEEDLSALREQKAGMTGAGPQVLGEGWASIVELDAEGLDLAGMTGAGPAPGGWTGTTEPGEPSDAPSGAPADIDPAALLDQLTTPVDGGRALSTALLSVLLTDDGRVLVGAVPVDALVAAAR